MLRKAGLRTFYSLWNIGLLQLREHALAYLWDRNADTFHRNCSQAPLSTTGPRPVINSLYKSDFFLSEDSISRVYISQ
jgi:hypothetical protein